MATDDLDLAAQAQESLEDPHGYVHGIAVDALKPIAEMAVMAWLSRNIWAAGNIHSGIELETDGTPVGYAEVSGYFINRNGRVSAAPAVAMSLANKSRKTANVRPLIKGVMERTGTYRPATGVFLKTDLWTAAKAWGVESL